MSGRREKYPSTYTTAGVKRMLARLLPPGPIWESTTVLALVEGLSGTWRRLMLRVADALREMRGGQAEETLAEWERELGLPVCPPGPSADADRRAAIAAALAGVGGQTPAYFVALAAAAGAVVTLEEGPTAPYTSFECGVADINNELGLGRTRYIWRVSFGLGTTAEADALTRCLFEKCKPSHSLIEWVPAPLALTLDGTTQRGVALGAVPAYPNGVVMAIQCTQPAAQFTVASALRPASGTEQFLLQRGIQASFMYSFYRGAVGGGASTGNASGITDATGYRTVLTWLNPDGSQACVVVGPGGTVTATAADTPTMGTSLTDWLIGTSTVAGASLAAMSFAQAAILPLPASPSMTPAQLAEALHGDGSFASWEAADTGNIELARLVLPMDGEDVGSDLVVPFRVGSGSMTFYNASRDDLTLTVPTGVAP